MNRTLFVGLLPANTALQTLQDYFSRFGEVEFAVGSVLEQESTSMCCICHLFIRGWIGKSNESSPSSDQCKLISIIYRCQLLKRRLEELLHEDCNRGWSFCFIFGHWWDEESFDSEDSHD
uniref:RRM domain-containing protein n=1 Tax=Ditylenchus dipsaci TaxID=166011 RepID=A0A915DHU0_9BILA